MNSIHIWLGPLIVLLINIFGTCLGLAYVWGKVRAKLETHTRELTSLKGGLYHPDGTLIYVTREECTGSHMKWESNVASQINDVKTMISDLRVEMNRNNELRNKEIQNLMKFVGRVEEHMKRALKDGG